MSKIFHTKISSRFFPGKRSQVTSLRTSYPYDTAKLFHILPVKINFDMETNGYIRNSAEEKNNVQELKKRQKKTYIRYQPPGKGDIKSFHLNSKECDVFLSSSKVTSCLNSDK